MDWKAKELNQCVMYNDVRYWCAPAVWQNKTVFVVGGGPSLKGRDLSFLHSRCVIGCNDTYMLGADIVDVCCFGDEGWFELHDRAELSDGTPGLRKYQGLKVTNMPEIEIIRLHQRLLAADVRLMRREIYGIANGHWLAWNTNTGMTALNLAVSLGASRVILLGFDMALSSTGENNWYINRKDLPNPKAYDRFLRNVNPVVQDLERHHKHVEVFNANPDSKLEAFPKITFEEATHAL